MSLTNELDELNKKRDLQYAEWEKISAELENYSDLS